MLFHYFNWFNKMSDKLDKTGKGEKTRRLCVEQLETREMLSGTGWETTLYDSFEPSETVLVAAVEVPSTIVLTGEKVGGNVNLSWTDFGPGFTYTLVRDGATIITDYTGNTYTDTPLLPNNTYNVYAINSSTGQVISSKTLQIGEMYNPTLNLEKLSDGSIKLSWENQQDFDSTASYGYILTKNDQAITPMLSGTSFIDTGVSANQLNAYVLYVYNYKTQKWTQSEAKAIGTLAAPGNLTFSNLKQNEFTVSWTPPSQTTGATHYEIQLYEGSTYSKTVTVPIGTNTYTFSGLTENTSYEVRLRTVAGPGEYVTSSSVVTATVETLSRLPAPTALTATAVTASSISLAWTPPTGPSEVPIVAYQIEWSKDGTWSSPQTVVGTSYTIQGLDALTSYQIRIRSVGSDGSTSNSVERTQSTALPKPEEFHVEQTKPNSVDLAWKAVAGASGYRVEWSSNNSTWSSTNVTYGASPTATVSGLTAGGQYYFRVTALGPSVIPSLDSVPSDVIDKTTPTALLGVPQNFAVIPGGNQVDCTWTAPANQAGVTGYLVEYRVSGSTGLWTSWPVAGVGTLATTIPGLSPGTYDFRISSTGATTAAPEGYAYVNGVAVNASAPTGLTATNVKATSLTLSWTKPANMTGVGGYRIEYTAGGVTNFQWVTNSGTGSTQQSELTGLAPNTQYTIHIAATNADGTVISDFSTAINPSTLLNTPQGLAAVGTTWNTVDLTWNTVTGATGYEIQYIYATGDWNTPLGTISVGPVTGSSVPNLPVAATTYAFRIRAISSGNDSDWSLPVSATTETHKLDAPTVTKQSATANSITIEWAPVTGAVSYSVTYRQGSSTPVTVSVSGNSFTTTLPLSAGTAYDFEIVAVSTAPGMTNSDPTPVQQATLPMAPGSLDVTDIGANTATLTWQWSGLTSTISGFLIEYSADGTTWESLITCGQADRKYSIPNDGKLSPNTEYEFRIQALGATGNLPSDFVYSGTILMKLIGPTNLAVTMPASDTAVLAWDPPADFATSAMTNYRLEWMDATWTDWNQANYQYLVKADTTVTVNDNFNPGVEYQFRLRAVILAGVEIKNDSVAEIKTVTTAWIKLDTPTGLSATSDANSITVTWNPVTDAKSYLVVWAYAGTLPETALLGKNHSETPIIGTSYTIDFLYDPMDATVKGTLFSGTEYVVWVYAMTDVYGYQSSNAAQFLLDETITQVESPSNFKAVSVDTGSVTLEWTAGALKGVDSYEIHYTGGGVDITITGISSLATSWIVDGLDANTTYTFEIIAVGTGGIPDSAPIPPVTATTTLGTPTGLTATAVNSSTIQLEWQTAKGAVGYWIEWIKADEAWEDINGVKNPAVESDWTTALTYHVVNLEAGQAYKFRVQSTGAGGVLSDYVYVNGNTNWEVSTGIDAPTLFTIDAVGTQDVTLTWLPPISLVGIKGYNIQYRVVGETVWNPANGWYFDGANTTTGIVRGLAPNTTYEFQIQSVAIDSGVPNSAWKGPVAMTIPTLPASPSGLYSTAYEWNSVSLAWAGPVEADPGTNGDYYVEYALSGTATWSAGQMVPAAEGTSYTVNGLDPFTWYDFRVMFAYSTGEGDSAYTNTVTVCTAQVKLAKPTNVDVVAAVDRSVIGSQPTVQATVDWTYTSSDVTPYTQNFLIQYRIVGEVDWIDGNMVAGHLTTATIDGLQPDTQYEFLVTAIGDGRTIETASDVKTFSTPTMAPWNLDVAAVESNSITLTWDAVLQDSVKSYWIVCTYWDGTDWAYEWVPVNDENATTATIDDLDASTAYWFYIVAADANGVPFTNDVSNVVSATTLPPMVDDVKAEYAEWNSSQGSIVRITWASVPGTAYNVYWYDDIADQWVLTTDKNDALGLAFVTGLTPATTYQFKVVSVDGTTESTPVTVSATTDKVPLDEPDNLVVVPASVTETTLTLQWDMPTSEPNQSYATSYGIKVSTDGIEWTDWGPVDVYDDGSFLFCDLEGLDPGQMYQFVVYAKGDQAETSPDSTATTEVMRTYSPMAVSVTSTSATVTLTWTQDDGRGICGYVVQQWSGSTWLDVAWPTPTEMSVAIVGLDASTEYSFRVVSYNSASQWSVGYAEFTATTLLAPPENVVVVEGTTVMSAKVTFDFPASHGDNINGFLITWQVADSTTIAGRKWIPIGSWWLGYEYEITDLDPATKYEITVTSWNSDRERRSDPVTEEWTTKAAQVKDVAFSLIAINDIWVAWTKPDFDEGIAGYQITCYDSNDIQIGASQTVFGKASGNVQFTGLDPCTNYYFEVVTLGESGIPASDPVRSANVITKFEISITQSVPANSWQEVFVQWSEYQGNDFVRYELEYATNPDFINSTTVSISVKANVSYDKISPAAATWLPGENGRAIAGQPLYVRVTVITGSATSDTIEKTETLKKVYNNPSNPLKPTVTSYNPSTGLLSWTPFIAAGPRGYITGFEIQYEISPGVWSTSEFVILSGPASASMSINLNTEFGWSLALSSIRIRCIFDPVRVGPEIVDGTDWTVWT